MKRRDWSSESSGFAHAVPPFYLNARAFAGYRVEHIISTGAVGAVVSAQHREHGRVAIKLLHPQLRNEPTLQSRLSREAHVLTRLASEHIVRLLDTGWTDTVGPYVVLEHLAGMDLARMLEKQHPLPISLAVEYALQACEALRVAHGAGITHRDIKPENLFAVDRGQAPLLKLLDFGISHHRPESFPYRDVVANDGEAQMMGTPAYMAPERILDQPRPGDAATICARIVKQDFTLEANRALVPASLRLVIARCLARDPAGRYRDVQELAESLAGAASNSKGPRGFLTGKFRRADASPWVTALPQVATESEASSLPLAAPAPGQLAPPASPRRRRWPWLVLALAVAVLVGVRHRLSLQAEKDAAAAHSAQAAGRLPPPASPVRTDEGEQ